MSTDPNDRCDGCRRRFDTETRHSSGFTVNPAGATTFSGGLWGDCFTLCATCRTSVRGGSDAARVMHEIARLCEYSFWPLRSVGILLRIRRLVREYKQSREYIWRG